MSRRFDSTALSSALLSVLSELGYENMTPIQEQSIPILLEGRDVIGQSKTGSGKTAAFSLPMLQKIDLATRSPQALVLCPTRELSTQVAREIRKLGRKHAGLQVLILSGGQPMPPQLNALRKGVHVVVGTPGRVLDHLRRKSLDSSKVAVLVLDEADQMLDMGFQEDMEQILASVPTNRQTVLFSATFPRSITSPLAKMSRAFQRDPVHVAVEEKTNAIPEIRQLLVQIEEENHDTAKLQALLGVLAKEQPQSAMVFCNRKTTVAELERALVRERVASASLHGDLEQTDRDRIMALFRNRSVRVLVATDVAARGLDVADLDLVVNFDLPSRPEIYVHRIGRTGRAGKSGLAVSLATTKDRRVLQAIALRTGAAMETIPLPVPPEGTAKSSLSQPVEMLTIYIGAGRKQKMRPGDILGALTGEAGFQASDIGRIEIHDHFSYVAVSRRIARAALTRLRMGQIKGRKFRVEPVR